MAITTYAELVSAISNWTTRTDLSTRAPEFIALCEAELNRRLVSRQRIAAEYGEVPGDFSGVRSLKIDGGNLLTQVTQEEMARRKDANTATGEPRYYCVVGGEFEFYPVPGLSYTAELTYRQKIPALSAGNTTNWVLTAHPDAYLYGALMHAAFVLDEAELGMSARSRFETAIAQIMADDVTQTHGGPLSRRVRPFA